MHAIPVRTSHHANPDADAIKRAGQRVRNWRRTQQPPLSQSAFAKLAKISVGCLQAFERGTRSTHDENVKKIARALGLTIAQLHDDVETAIDVLSHPLLRDLRKEDYRIAHAYHHAAADLKFAVKGLLSERIDEDLRERHARALVSMQQLHIDLLVAVEQLIIAWKADYAMTRATPAIDRRQADRRVSARPQPA